jgi:hypothetical protein
MAPNMAPTGLTGPLLGGILLGLIVLFATYILIQVILYRRRQKAQNKGKDVEKQAKEDTLQLSGGKTAAEGTKEEREPLATTSEDEGAGSGDETKRGQETSSSHKPQETQETSTETSNATKHILNPSAPPQPPS